MSHAKPIKSVLLADDDDMLRRVVSHHLEEAGYQVTAVAQGSDALKVLENSPADLLITDIQMPGMDGYELITRVRQMLQDVPIVAITAFGSIESAVQAMKLGAEDYITKPFSKEQLLHMVGKALERGTLLAENRYLRNFVGEYFSLDNMIGTSRSMRDVYEIVRKIAQTPVTVLITGESGTGKELLAKAIHQNSTRAQRQFVAINCAAIPEGLVESEFFGHKKGSFTSASSDSRGKLELADGGTLFLDEIGDLPLPMQTKLLRVLQDGAFFRVGDSVERHVDVRFIAATNRNLENMIENRTFREELYFRLNVVPIRIPALRDRREDIPLLADHFLREAATRYSRPQIRLGKEVLIRFQNYDWPGNVRQLQNVVERMVVLANGDSLTPNDLPEEIRNQSRTASKLMFELPAGGLDLENVERDLITHALERHHWNQTATSKYLNITRSVLMTRMQKYGLRQPSDAATNTPA